MSVPARGSRRQEGREKVTGATRFTADLEHAGLLHVHLVLAHTASARIRGIETGRARSSPGVVDVVTARDLPELDSAGPDLPLALERVFYVGQPVVAVVAETEAAAADAALLVEVDYEDAPPVVDASLAMTDQSPLVLGEHEAADDEDASIHGASAAADDAPEERPRNVTGVAHLRRGDAERALEQADVVIRETYRFAGAHHSFMEPHVAVVRPEPDGGLTIWSSTQGPFVIRDSVAALVDLPPHKVRVVPMAVGGGFGGKIELLEPLGEASPIEKFLERNPDGGIHHICYEAEDILAARDKLKSEGARVLGDGNPRIGAHGKPVLFLHPKDFCGTLVEIEQA